LWPVPSLDVGAGVDSSAVTLFSDRARAVAPHFSMPDEAKAVVEICDRLDGIPLAIELAASRMASMTASEVRDRLDQRFQLLVGSRRGLGRHQTLRHAVAWSFDLLDDAEKSLLTRCSVFAGGFGLESACAVAGSNTSDDYAVLNLLDALVRKSLLVADRLSGRTRFSMLETIRQFAEEQLATTGEATEGRDAHARHFAGRENEIMSLWDSPRQREAYIWFTAELANLRTAFRWAADHNDLDAAAALATWAGLLGVAIENYEPVAWAEELIGPASAIDHPRLAALYYMASFCYTAGRVEEAVRYSDAGQIILGRNRDVLPYGIEGAIGAGYMYLGQPERWAEMCRTELRRRRDASVGIRATLVVALVFAGRSEEAMAAADDLIEPAEATGNPWVLSIVLAAYGLALRDADPARAMDALRRGLAVAQDSGNRFIQTQLAALNLSQLEATQGDIASAFDHLSLAIRNMHDTGNTTTIRSALALLATVLDRLGRYESAATIAGFALTPLTEMAYPEITTAIAHLHDVLGDQAYESLARKGEAMTTAEMVTYAYDQIDQARAELNAVSE
jgi:tetratricopeptide (TPR) repeat protein